MISRTTTGNMRIVVFGVVGSLGLVAATHAQKLTSSRSLEKIPAVEQVASKVIGNLRVEANTGRPLALYALSEKVAPADAETMARQYLREQARLLQLPPNPDALAHVKTLETPGGFHVRFLQQVDGIPVYRGEVAVNINRRHEVCFVMNGYNPALAASQSMRAQLTAERALREARRYLAVRGAVIHESAELVIYPTKTGFRLSYRVTLVPGESPFGDWEMLIDANNGEIFRVEDRALYSQPMPQQRRAAGPVDGKGMVYDPDPLTSARALYNAPGFRDNSDTDSQQLTAIRVERDLLGIDFDGSQYHLSGFYANVEDFESPYFGQFSQDSSNFRFTRSQQGFEAVNVYYHIDKSMRYINDTLVYPVMPFQYTGGVRVDPHGLGGADNSHYVPTIGGLAFGEGGVDDAEDPDVILHELGHGLHDWLTAGQISQEEGLSEGCGDYWCKSYNRSIGVWGPGDPQYHWTFQWDGHNEFWLGRVTNYPAQYPSGLVGQIHQDGQIWASTLMSIHDEIGRTATDRNFLECLSMLNSNSNQNDAAQAFLQADVNLHGGANLNTIFYWLQQRGYSVTIPAEPGAIEVVPTTLAATVQTGDTTTQYLNIKNVGSSGSVLNFNLGIIGGEIPSATKLQQRSGIKEARTIAHRELTKGSIDDRVGEPVLASTGGPDDFGYVWIDSDEQDGPSFAWFDIQNVGTRHFLGDDNAVQVVLPFSFPFYGAIKTTVLIASNGYLTFGSDGSDYDNDNIPDTNDPNDLIAAFWDDLNPPGGGQVHHYFDSTASRFVVQYTNVPAFSGGGSYTFQIILQPDGSILFQYLSMTGQLRSATIGIENKDASDGLKIVFNSDYVHSNMAVSIRRVERWLSTNITRGSLPAGETAAIAVKFDAARLSAGDYTAILQIASNDSANESLSVPVSLQVGGPIIPVWLAPLTITNLNNTVDQFTLAFGGDSVATDGFDTDFDSLAPPTGQNYSAFFISADSANLFTHDVRKWQAPYDQKIVWQLRIVNAAGVSSEITWNSANLPASGSFELADSLALQIIDMRLVSRAEFGGNLSATITYRPEAPPPAPFVFDFPQAGWYLISLPLVPSDGATNKLFPSAGGVFGWDFAAQRYVPSTVMQPGRAYWIFMPQPGEVPLAGTIVKSFVHNYDSTGWDLIGAATDTAAWNDLPDSSVAELFAWDPLAASYVSVTSPELHPMQGYWMFVAIAPCTVTVGENSVESIFASNQHLRKLSGGAAVAGMPPGPPRDLLKIAKQESSPPQFALLQNYPNPFNPTTTIEFQLPESSLVELEIFTLLGRRVRTLASGRVVAGLHRIEWNGRDEAGSQMDSGSYFCQLKVTPSLSGRSQIQTRKLLLLK